MSFLRLTLSVVAGVLLLSGCAQISIQKYAAIDQSAKTISVPRGSWGLNGLLKQALANEGWTMVVRSGSTLTEGTFGQKVSLKTVSTYNTRYSLSLNCLQPDGLAGVNIIGEPEYIYDLSLVDNLTGQEVLTSSVNAPGLPPHIIMPKLKEVFR